MRKKIALALAVAMTTQPLFATTLTEMVPQNTPMSFSAQQTSTGNSTSTGSFSGSYSKGSFNGTSTGNSKTITTTDITDIVKISSVRNLNNELDSDTVLSDGSMKSISDLYNATVTADKIMLPQSTKVNSETSTPELMRLHALGILPDYDNILFTRNGNSITLSNTQDSSYLSPGNLIRKDDFVNALVTYVKPLPEADIVFPLRHKENLANGRENYFDWLPSESSSLRDKIRELNLPVKSTAIDFRSGDIGIYQIQGMYKNLLFARDAGIVPAFSLRAPYSTQVLSSQQQNDAPVYDWSVNASNNAGSQRTGLQSLTSAYDPCLNISLAPNSISISQRKDSSVFYESKFRLLDACRMIAKAMELKGEVKLTEEEQKYLVYYYNVDVSQLPDEDRDVVLKLIAYGILDDDMVQQLQSYVTTDVAVTLLDRLSSPSQRNTFKYVSTPADDAMIEAGFSLSKNKVSTSTVSQQVDDNRIYKKLYYRVSPEMLDADGKPRFFLSESTVSNPKLDSITLLTLKSGTQYLEVQIPPEAPDIQFTLNSAGMSDYPKYYELQLNGKQLRNGIYAADNLVDGHYTTKEIEDAELTEFLGVKTTASKNVFKAVKYSASTTGLAQPTADYAARVFELNDFKTLVYAPSGQTIVTTGNNITDAGIRELLDLKPTVIVTANMRRYVTTEVQGSAPNERIRLTVYAYSKESSVELNARLYSNFSSKSSPTQTQSSPNSGSTKASQTKPSYNLPSSSITLTWSLAEYRALLWGVANIKVVDSDDKLTDRAILAILNTKSATGTVDAALKKFIVAKVDKKLGRASIQFYPFNGETLDALQQKIYNTMHSAGSKDLATYVDKNGKHFISKSKLESLGLTVMDDIIYNKQTQAFAYVNKKFSIVNNEVLPDTAQAIDVPKFGLLYDFDIVKALLSYESQDKTIWASKQANPAKKTQISVKFYDDRLRTFNVESNTATNGQKYVRLASLPPELSRFNVVNMKSGRLVYFPAKPVEWNADISKEDLQTYNSMSHALNTALLRYTFSDKAYDPNLGYRNMKFAMVFVPNNGAPPSVYNKELSEFVTKTLPSYMKESDFVQDGINFQKVKDQLTAYKFTTAKSVFDISKSQTPIEDIIRLYGDISISSSPVAQFDLAPKVTSTYNSYLPTLVKTPKSYSTYQNRCTFALIGGELYVLDAFLRNESNTCLNFNGSDVTSKSDLSTFEFDAKFSEPSQYSGQLPTFATAATKTGVTKTKLKVIGRDTKNMYLMATTNFDLSLVSNFVTINGNKFAIYNLGSEFANAAMNTCFTVSNYTQQIWREDKAKVNNAAYQLEGLPMKYNGDVAQVSDTKLSATNPTFRIDSTQSTSTKSPIPFRVIVMPNYKSLMVDSAGKLKYASGTIQRFDIPTNLIGYSVMASGSMEKLAKKLSDMPDKSIIYVGTEPMLLLAGIKDGTDNILYSQVPRTDIDETGVPDFFKQQIADTFNPKLPTLGELQSLRGSAVKDGKDLITWTLEPYYYGKETVTGKELRVARFDNTQQLQDGKGTPYIDAGLAAVNSTATLLYKIDVAPTQLVVGYNGNNYLLTGVKQLTPYQLERTHARDIHQLEILDANELLNQLFSFGSINEIIDSLRHLSIVSTLASIQYVLQNAGMYVCMGYIWTVFLLMVILRVSSRSPIRSFCVGLVKILTWGRIDPENKSVFVMAGMISVSFAAFQLISQGMIYNLIASWNELVFQLTQMLS